jgi:2,4-dienoyl-CoA reductase (NADPH2)
VPKIPGLEHAKVLSYIDVLRHAKPVGRKVAIIGAGGIGFDVAEYLVHDGPSPSLDPALWAAEWGIGDPAQARGGIDGIKPHVSPPAREVMLLQRSAGKVGARLGKTTGWIHRATLKMKNVQMVSGVNYERIGDQGLLISHGEKREDPTWLEVDHVILCAGQEPLRELIEPLAERGVKTHLIGGAFEAAELDAKRAIDQASRLAATL